MKINPKGLKAFTLIELLVVITIIGILASLAIPAIGAAIDKANQTKDISNIKQVGTILFTDANGNAGVFRRTPAGGTGDFTTSTDLFQDMINDGTITTPSVLAGTGVAPSSDPAALAAANVAWDYVLGLKTSSNSNLPLLISYGSGAGDADIISDAEFSIATLDPATSMWGPKGVVIYYLGGNARFMAPGKDGAGVGKIKFASSPIVATPKVLTP